MVSHKIILPFLIFFSLILSNCAKITPSPREITDDERIELRAIVVPTSDQAEEIYKELSGGKPFWLLAQEKSVHPSSREGGFLGLVRKKELGREYQKALEGLKEGDYSGIFKTGDGYYALVQLTTTRYFKKSLEFFLNGSLDEAAEGFLKDLAFNPDNTYSYMTLGVIYDRKGDFEKAIEMHNAALELDPSNETVYNNLATTYFNSDRPKAAIETYKRALEIAPDSANIKNNLAWVYANEGVRLDEGITMIKELIEKEPGKAKYIETLSELYYRKGMYDDALREIRKAIEIEPNNENLRMQSKKIEDAKNRKLQPLIKREKAGLDVGISLKDSVLAGVPLKKGQMAGATEGMEEKKSYVKKEEEQKKEVSYSDEKEFGPESGWEEIKPPVSNVKEENKIASEPDKKAERDVYIKILVPKKGAENEMITILRKMGYKISMIGKADKHTSVTTIYYRKGFKDVAGRINKNLKGRQVIRPITWRSIFDIIISVRD